MSEPKDQPKKAVRLEIKIDDPIAAGTYANLAIINHSDAEFVFDFVFIQPARPRSKVASRIIMSPKNAKRMMMALQHQMKVFEKQFGELAVAPPTGKELTELEIN
jgi:hypothetical protein